MCIFGSICLEASVLEMFGISIDVSAKGALLFRDCDGIICRLKVDSQISH